MKASAEIYAFIDEKALVELLDNNEDLKNFVEQEAERVSEKVPQEKCSCCRGGCGHGCGTNCDKVDPAYLTAAMMSIFNYYIPDNIKNAIHLGGSTFIE